MAIANTPTLLSLDRYAKIMGITPLHFNQATATGTGGVEIFPNSSSASTCSGVWYQHAWQSPDGIGREELAIAIANAEQDIADYIGYYPAPKWISQEFHRYPKHWHRGSYDGGVGVYGTFKSVLANYGKFIQAGRRAVSLIATPTVTYTDDDGDGFYETGTITASTTLTDTCEIKAYFAGHNGGQEYEIRSPRSITVSGGTLTIMFDSWTLIDPALWEAFPTSNDSDRVIQLSDTSKFVSTIDVYREYTDTTQESAQFYWEKTTNLANSFACPNCSGSGCAQCSLSTQGGCVHVRDVEHGILVPTPASYDSDNAVWTNQKWVDCREPDQVKIWYLAGDYDNRCRSGATCDPLSDFWATTIAWLATARLGGRMCDCDDSFGRFAKELQSDVLDADTGLTYVGVDVTSNPFGTRFGEVRAWQRLEKFGRRQLKGYAV